MEKYGICLQAMIPVRKSPGDKNEMINQLLFGDLVRIKDEVENWYLIEGAEDQYEGWTDQKQIYVLAKDHFDQLMSAPKYYLNEITGKCINQEDQTMTHLAMGSRIPGLKEQTFQIGDISYSSNSACFEQPLKPDKSKVEETALKYLNAPYLWGGRSPFGIDCSGFTQIVYKMSGYELPRDAWQQVVLGETVDFVHEAQPGDLAFFGNEEGNIIHVGIILENQKIIHASGKVRIDKIDHHGIFNEQENNYTHQLRIIKRII